MTPTKNVLYFYHSKPTDIPLIKGKRVTVCVIIKEDEVCFGVSSLHESDYKIWTKEKARLIAQSRASNGPNYCMKLPKEDVRKIAYQTCRELALKEFVSNAMRSFDNIKRKAERQQAKIDKLYVSLISSTTAVKELGETGAFPAKRKTKKLTAKPETFGEQLLSA